MAATFTEVTLEDMEKFLRRAYNVYRPKKGESRGEVYYDLSLSKGEIFIRVWTSIRPRSGVGADKGTDAIRVTMVTRGGKPLVPKGTIVKRTQNWRTSLQSRIDDLLDDYEAKTDYWKTRQKDRDNDGAEVEEEDDNDEAPPAPPPPGQEGPHAGMFSLLPNDTWGAKIFSHGASGDKAVLEKKDRSRVTVVLHEKVFEGKDRYSGKYSELWSIAKSRAASDVTVALVMERVLAAMDSNGLDRDDDDLDNPHGQRTRLLESAFSCEEDADFLGDDDRTFDAF